MSDLQELRRVGQLVDAELRSFFAWAAERVPQPRTGEGPGAMLSAIEDLTLRGGKRLRPALAYFAAGAVADDADTPGLVPACCALELLQSYLLIHDDIMDGDTLRRGGPTVHVMLAGDGGDGERGRMLGILAGDLAATAARWALQRAELPADRRAAADRELARMEWDVIHGQYLDYVGSPDVGAVHDLKTASYTTRGPVRFGAALAGADGAQVAALEAFATPLGLAFQIRDDLLDITGDPAVTGKAVGIDLREGRLSAVLDEALARATGDDRARIERVWGAGEPPEDELAAALAAVRASGAVEACVERVRSHTEEAVAALRGAPLRSAGTAPLVDVARALAARVG